MQVKQLVSFKGDHFALPEADLFMLLLVKIPRWVTITISESNSNVKYLWWFTNEGNLVPASYEERLNCLVVKEEFFPLMDEMKEFISTLTNAGNGIIYFFRI